MARCPRCVVKMKKLSAGHFACPTCGAHRHDTVPASQVGAPLPVPDHKVNRPEPAPAVHKMNWLHT